MNKNQKIYILIIVFASLSYYTFAGDVPGGYIGELLVKSDAGKDPLLALLEESGDKGKELAEKNDTKKVPAVKKADPRDAVKTVKAAVEKNAGAIEKADSAILNKSKLLREKLKKSSISSLPDVSNTSLDSQLQEVLSQLQSLRFPEKDGTGGKDGEVSLNPEEITSKPVEKASPAKSGDNVESKSITEEKKPSVVIPEDDTDIVDVFELAESLFYIGDKANALKYYRKALDMTLPVGKTANPKRAWILFQTGNCLYGVDNLEAIKIFEQLLLEHPNCDWTSCARTKKQVLKWLTVEKPMTLTAGEIK